jgi:D-alanyl-D-alanine carboxypeptidase/D-alanyl-D-alanine-endopeptidase (penicillin-binding protein 4)
MILKASIFGMLGKRANASTFSRVLLVLLPLFPMYTEDIGATGFFEISRNLSSNDALLITDSEDRIVFSKNAGVKMIPASTLKIFTTLMAFHYLGPEYRFPTEVYQDDHRNLKVKGFGDPFFTSEVIEDLASRIAGKTTVFNELILDDTFFQNPLVIPGVSTSSNPYDSPNGALCANFNTIHFRIGSSGKYESAESQTPLIPFALTKIRASGAPPGRVVFSHKNGETTAYAGHLLAHFLLEEGVSSSGKIRWGKVDTHSDRLLFRFFSPFSLLEVCRKLLEHSNNFTANQIFIACGAKGFGEPATLEKAVKAARRYAQEHLGIMDLTIFEGSGISRKNRLSATAMTVILNAFKPYHTLLKQDGSRFYKTGTLKGIKTRAGYVIKDDGDSVWTVVLYLNASDRSADGIMEKIDSTLIKGSVR